MDAKQREKFFKPYRLQILKISDRGRSVRSMGYAVVVRDVTVNGEASIVKVWEIHGRDMGAWMAVTGKPDLHSHNHYFLALERAEVAAVREAEIQQLPFNRNRDILAVSDVVQGPTQRCLDCERRVERGFEPVVCESCRAALATGRQTFGERKLYVVQYFDLLEYLFGNNTDDHSKQLIELILNLIGTRLAGDYQYDDPEGQPEAVLVNPERGSGLGGGRGWKQKVFLTPEQFSAIQTLLAHVNVLGKAAQQRGRERGESLLLSLAQNDLSVDDFNKMSVHHSRFAKQSNGDGDE